MMAVIKELQWLAAAGECGRVVTNHRLVTGEVNSLRDYSVCSIDSKH